MGVARQDGAPERDLADAALPVGGLNELDRRIQREDAARQDRVVDHGGGGPGEIDRARGGRRDHLGAVVGRFQRARVDLRTQRDHRADIVFERPQLRPQPRGVDRQRGAGVVQLAKDLVGDAAPGLALAAVRPPGFATRRRPLAP